MTKRTRSSKKINERDNEKDLFSMLPLELIVEILLKLPAKLVVSFIFVSKHWSSIIRSKDFTKLYNNRSLARPRFLFIVEDGFMQMEFLESCSQEDPYSDHQKVKVTLDRSLFHGISSPVHSLMCLQNDKKSRIVNPSTGQFLALPRVNTRRQGLISFLGYDTVNDVHKVLCMTVLRVNQGRRSRAVSHEHQVFTLGPKQKWRKIACKHRHLPPFDTKGIFINGILYYYAWIKSDPSLICFDFTSEDFTVVKLPMDTQSLVNYNGKIALIRKQFEATLELWVLQDVKTQDWFEVSHLVPSWTDLVETQAFRFQGTLGTGQLIFAPLDCDFDYPYFLISYDPNKNTAKRVVIDGIGDENSYPFVELYLDHVESPMLL